MHKKALRLLTSGASVVVFVSSCSSTDGGGFGQIDNGPQPSSDDGGETQGLSPGDASPTFNDAGNAADVRPEDGSVTVTTLIYGNTDNTLYSMDPSSQKITMIGPFAGVSGGSTDGTVTDCAVNRAGDVYVNTESVVYKATLPKTPPGTVQLTQVVTIPVRSGQRFYALAFAPQGVLGSGEVLVGGDGNGELWSIDTTSGAMKDLGNFGPDRYITTGNVLALSGDIVFYLDSANQPTGLATIRSCQPGSSNCNPKNNDFLAAIDVSALANAYSSGTPGVLLKGIYGSTSSPPGYGPGTGFGYLFGLGVWQGEVFAFERVNKADPAQLVLIDTSAGTGKVVPGQTFGFPDGWSGAGVSTSVTVNVPPPPPPPK